MAGLCGVGLFACALLHTQPAQALLLDNVMEGLDDVELTHFYPYPTSYTKVDRRFAFDDDPLRAFRHKPYEVTLVIQRLLVHRGLVSPRTSFVQEMYKSTEAM